MDYLNGTEWNDILPFVIRIQSGSSVNQPAHFCDFCVWEPSNRRNNRETGSQYRCKLKTDRFYPQAAEKLEHDADLSKPHLKLYFITVGRFLPGMCSTTSESTVFKRLTAQAVERLLRVSSGVVRYIVRAGCGADNIMQSEAMSGDARECFILETLQNTLFTIDELIDPLQKFSTKSLSTHYDRLLEGCITGQTMREVAPRSPRCESSEASEGVYLVVARLNALSTAFFLPYAALRRTTSPGRLSVVVHIVDPSFEKLNSANDCYCFDRQPVEVFANYF